MENFPIQPSLPSLLLFGTTIDWLYPQREKGEAKPPSTFYLLLKLTWQKLCIRSQTFWSHSFQIELRTKSFETWSFSLEAIRRGRTSHKFGKIDTFVKSAGKFEKMWQQPLFSSFFLKFLYGYSLTKEHFAQIN